MTRPRASVAAGLAAALLPLLAACGDTSDEDSGPATTAAVPAARPEGIAEVREVFADELAALGVRVTDEGGVIDLHGEGYEPSEEGTHLSLYLQPEAAYSDEQYLAGLLDSARALGPEVFRRWGALESFDICQLPVDGDEGGTVTRLDMSRSMVEELDWASLDLSAFLALAGEREDADIRVYVARELRETPAFQAAMAEAGLA